MKRRTFLAGAATVAILPAAAVLAPPPEKPVAALVEAVMGSIVSGRSDAFCHVTKAELRALCEATGVRWREHWAIRETKAASEPDHAVG